MADRSSVAVSWLHVSDIHFRNSAASVHADTVLDKMYKDVRQQIREHGINPDFICLSGDVAFSGKEEEYTMAGESLGKLQRAAANGAALPAVFMVPGNHDVDRSRIGRIARLLHQAILADATVPDQPETTDILEKDAESRRYLFEKFENYASAVVASRRPARSAGTASDTCFDGRLQAAA